MKIAVVGAGAMGSIFGARFGGAGLDTTFVDVSQPLVNKINADGVTIVRAEEETATRVPATTDPASVGAVDIAVFFVKCYQTRSAAEAARPLVGPETVVASLQNGWGNGDVLASVYDPGQIVVGVTYNSGTAVGLGQVAHAGVGPTYVGPYAGGSLGAAEMLSETLARCGLEAHATQEIGPEVWKKLVLNAATLPTAALTGMNAGALTAHEDIHELVSAVAREAIAVAQLLGYEIDEQERVDYIHTLLERAGSTKASMLQDFEAGRRTEIDVINGAVVKAGHESGVPVPLNQALVALVKGWESMRGLGE
jgi:2-dehydropantoate 2-reductase